MHPMQIRKINGWVPPSPTVCNPTRITQVDSETDSMGNLKIKKILSRKVKFQLEWNFITWDLASRIMKEFDNFDAVVVYEDMLTGEEKTGRFYPGDYSPVPSVILVNGKPIYEKLPLNIVEK